MRKLILILIYIPLLAIGQYKGLWNLNNNANDISGFGHNGSTTNVTWVQGYLGQAASMSGTGYIEMNSPMTVNGTSSYTLFCIINPNVVNVAYQRIFTQKSTSAATNEFGGIVVLNNNKITAYATNTVTTFDAAIDPGTAVAGRKYYIAASFDGNNVKLYINGVMVNSAAYSAGTKTANNNTNSWIIGAYLQQSTYYGKFNGIIDQCELVSPALTGAQINNEYIYYSMP